MDFIHPSPISHAPISVWAFLFTTNVSTIIYAKLKLRGTQKDQDVGGVRCLAHILPQTHQKNTPVERFAQNI